MLRDEVISFGWSWTSARKTLSRELLFVMHLDLDPIQLNRIKVWILWWSMNFSENQFPLFGIML
jgi:hypothetical protein